ADDPVGFSPDHRVVADLARRHPGIRITRCGAVAAMLIKGAVAQVVTGKEAKASYRRLTEAVGEPAPGPTDLLLPPDPAVLAAMAYHRYHPFGIERKRAETIIRIARHAGRLDEAARLPTADAYRRMLAVPGVGPWTAALAGLTALGDADAVPVGDYNLRHAVAWVLAGERRATDERMLELLEPYAGHRGRVIRLVKASGAKAPRYGPRRPLRNIERI
ncbi:MAG: DNA-3-methyladenine glycosylase 2 family protein, partial [Actinobacteria bacterium]|nr:DNA-3-methyladenine glycosylase 2 family protein [Actinomycetota bacterium]